MNAIIPQTTADCNTEDAAAEAWLNACVARVRIAGRFAEFVVITPAMARVLLKRNAANRTLIAAGIREWAAALKRGEWEVNGEGVIVSDTGELNDGQHRLSAVIETGISLPTLIVFGVTRDSRKTVNVGKKRTAGHVLAMSGVQNSSLIATAAKFHLNLRTGAHLTAHRSIKEVEAEIEAFPGLLTYRNSSNKFAREFRLSTGLFAALHQMMEASDKAKADAFFDLLSTGLGLTAAHPATTLHKRLQANLSNKAKLPVTQVAALTIKAWNAFVEGRSIQTLRWTTEGDAPETFPRIK